MMVYIQLLIPIYMFLGNTITIIITPIIYAIIFYLLGNPIEIIIVLTILFTLGSPYLRIPMYEYLMPRISTPDTKDHTMLSRVKNYFLPF